MYLVLFFHAIVLSDYIDKVSKREGIELIKRHRARFKRKQEERSKELTPRSSSGRRAKVLEYTRVITNNIADKSIVLDSKLDLNNNIATTHIYGTQGGGSRTFDIDKAPGVC